jgi:hypothetical protein
MHLHVEPRANQDQPIAFDLVAVRSKMLGGQLLKMTAADWFEHKGQIRSDYPSPRDMEIQSWEWVPGQQIGELPVHLAMRPKQAFVFAKYAAGGENRARLDTRQPATIVLGEKKMTVVEAGQRFVPVKPKGPKN